MADSLESALLRDAGFRHAFFTRGGGVSSGPFASLNFAVSVGDEPALVEENLRRAAAKLDVDATRIYFLSQVHGRTARLADGKEPARTFLETEGDVVVSAAPGLACAVRSADCVPILLACRRTGHVAAVHAGWRGVAGGAVQAGVAALRSVAQGEVDLVAAVGPHISCGAFEVSEEVAATLEDASPVAAVVDRTHERPHVNLRRIVDAQLRRCGVSQAAIDHVTGCTFGEPERFFSFRRDGKRSGRHLSAIVPRI